MITKLKTECGYQFTSKLEGMFKDISMSKETNRNFLESSRLKNSKINLSVYVLTTGFWPTVSVPVCNLPKNYNGRRLHWQTNMGTAALKLHLPKGKEGQTRKELYMTTYQMCILMLYNDSDTLTFADIRKKTNIPLAELKRYPRKFKKIDDSMTFTFNDNFKSKLFRVKLPLVSIVENKSVKSAAIVRIMKARMQLDHNALIAEIARQLNSRFRATPQQMKKCIESLIEREYIERDKNDRKVYMYI
eukprot:GSMAST32.ASY1.ANO1.1121.1 assembled CDS